MADLKDVVDIHLAQDHAVIKLANGTFHTLQYTDQESKLRGLHKQLLVEHIPESNTLTKDFSVEWEGKRWRGHSYNHQSGWTIALRLIVKKIPKFEELGVDGREITQCAAGQGLTLFCGPPGSGKTTVMACCVNSLLEANRLGPTVTIEDPIEYMHDSHLIRQREIGTHVASFEEGLIHATREALDTIVIGEIRDAETARQAVRAGLSGHRVLATMHGQKCSDAISRIWSLLDQHYAQLLPQAIQGVVAMHLVRLKNHKPTPLYESLLVDQAVRGLLGGPPEQRAAATTRLIHEQNRQKRKTLKERADELVNKGFPEAELVRWLDS